MKKTALLLVILCTMTACSRYERQVPSFKLPDGNVNAQEIYDAAVAAQAYNDGKEAKRAFGFDIVDAGLMPVQIVFDNRGESTLEIVPAQTFLIDEQNNAWPIMDEKLAYDRISSKTSMGNIAASAVKPGILSATAGALIGAAVGIVSGENVLEAAGKGAAVGAAAGATLGGASEAVNQSAEQQISDDLRTRKLQNKKITPQGISYGFLFFPAEAKTAKELRLQIRDVNAGTSRMLRFTLR